MSVHKISENYYVTGQISPADIPAIAGMGIKSIICNRPDGEGTGQPAFHEIENAAHKAGIKAKHMPVAPGPVQPIDASNLSVALEELAGPVLAYCGSGARAVNLWKLQDASKAA
ncbi:MAG: TIGR01244 family sulfur transferase [Rhizobiaceae bacterium]|nr:TIGR01244 family sulfur transferase [Rhizobiaceae bacterium]